VTNKLLNSAQDAVDWHGMHVLLVVFHNNPCWAVDTSYLDRADFSIQNLGTCKHAAC
jgi:hypothetical protein